MLASLGRSVSGAFGLQLSMGLRVPLAAACCCAVGTAGTRAQTQQQQQQQQQPQRGYSSSSGDVNVDEETNAINDAFVQAREDIADAKDDAETVYFNESASIARKSVDEVLAHWNGLLGRVPDKTRGELVRSMGLKMEQLKAELKELDELHT